MISVYKNNKYKIAVLEMKIWIYLSESNSWIYFIYNVYI
jgi:hypothetical protein